VGSLVPAEIDVHLPAVAGSLHDWHGPLHAALQQTFCAEHTRPEPHWFVAEQGPPGGSSPHEPLMQVAFDAQSALAVHVDLHTAAPHR